ncbi:MAG: alpha/beta hydrolase [Paenibacillus sp.]|nr:alpha/beta hydrolase [Paenibacillus sp.]
MTNDLKHILRSVEYAEVTIESNKAPILLSIWKSCEEDRCIVFYPGTATHPLFYETFLSALACNNFNVIGVHPVCHGNSPRVKKIFDFEELVQNGMDAVTYAIKNLNKNIVVMGSSQGGIVAIALAGKDKRIQAVFPHNILVPSIPDSITVTRFPNILKKVYRPVVQMVKLVAKVLPELPIPVRFYLDLKKVSGDKQIIKQFIAILTDL